VNKDIELRPQKKRKSRTLVIGVVLAVVIGAAIAAGILYFMILGLAPSAPNGVVGEWGKCTVHGPKSATIEFGVVEMGLNDVRPLELEIWLERNGTIENRYAFHSDFDGGLNIIAGPDNVALTYEDKADNIRIDVGDEIHMSNLSPGSEYRIRMIWKSTGDIMATKGFSTPVG
jgi:hypothetical protein